MSALIASLLLHVAAGLAWTQGLFVDRDAGPRAPRTRLAVTLEPARTSTPRATPRRRAPLDTPPVPTDPYAAAPTLTERADPLAPLTHPDPPLPARTELLWMRIPSAEGATADAFVAVARAEPEPVDGADAPAAATRPPTPAADAAPASPPDDVADAADADADTAADAATASTTAPVARSDNPPPVYPRWARRRGQQGEVLVHVHVSAAGAALRVELARSSGHPVLDEAALEAVAGWRFEPALADGRPTAGVLDVPIRFALIDG